MSKDHYAQCLESREHTNLPMDSKELANLMFGCTECVPGDRAAAAACPVCQKVAKEVADRELDGDDEEEEEDDDDDKHNVLDYDPDLTDADYAAHAASVGATEEATEEAAEDKVGAKRKAAHGDDCECPSCDWDGGEQHRMLENLIYMKRRHADELDGLMCEMPDPLYLTKSEQKEATALIADKFPGCEEDAMMNHNGNGGFDVEGLASDLVSE
jgi:hypothetical protein